MELPVKATAVRTAVDRQRTSGGGGRAEAGPSPTLPAADPGPAPTPRPGTACPGSEPTAEVHSSLCPAAWPLRSVSRACGLQTL